MINIFYGFLIFFAPLVYGDTGSSASGSGSGSATNGQVQLGHQSISSMDSDIPQAISQSQNTASGTSISLYGNTNTGLNLDPVDAVTRPTYYAYNGANSNGNAMTGILQNNDQSHSNTTGQQHFSIGQSQTTGNGTGVSISNYGSANLNRREYTTQSPYTTRCYVYCNYPCFPSDRYCYCVCPPDTKTSPLYTYAPSPSPVTAVPFVESEGGQRKVAPHSGNRQRMSPKAAEKKERKVAGTQGRTRKEEQKNAPAQSRTQGKPQQKLRHDLPRTRTAETALFHRA